MTSTDLLTTNAFAPRPDITRHRRARARSVRRRCCCPTHPTAAAPVPFSLLTLYRGLAEDLGLFREGLVRPERVNERVQRLDQRGVGAVP